MMDHMFSLIAVAAGVVVAWYAIKDQKSDSDDVATNVKHSRQDLRFIAYLLFAILVMLGVIADRLH